MNVILFNPPVWPYVGFHLGLNPNIGLLYLASVLRDKGHEVRVIDAEALKWTHKTCLAVVGAEGPDVVGITATTAGYKSMVDMSRGIRSKFPDIHIMIGGSHVSVYPEKALKETRADCAVSGEGEYAVEEALKYHGVIVNQTRTDVDTLLRPAWDLLYPTINSGIFRGNAPLYDLPETAVQWERGCPHGCYFCSHPVHGNKPTWMREPESIVEEVVHLKDVWGIKTCFVYDDEMIGLSGRQRMWLLSVLDLLRKTGVKMTFKTQGRCNVELVDKELLQEMKKAGFKALMLGCESGSPKVLRANHKGTTVDDIRHTLRLCHEVGIETYTFWMVGNIEETDEDAMLTEALLKELKPYITFKQVTICTPWAGSVTHKRAYEEGWVFENDLSQFLANKPVMNTPWMSAQEQLIWQRRLVQA